MKVLPLVVSVIIVTSVYADDNSEDGSWIYEIAGSDYAVGYCQSTLTLSFYNSKMGIDLTFDGTHGFHSMINATSGVMQIVHPRTGMAKLEVAPNKKKLLAAFASKNNTLIFDEVAKATVNSGIILPAKNSYNILEYVMGMFTKRNNDHKAAIEGKTDVLLTARKNFYQLKAAMISYAQTNPLRTENGVLIHLVSALIGPQIICHDFPNLMSTIITYLHGKFNQDLMTKVGSLIKEGQKEKFSKNIFNSLSAAISLVAPYTTGLDLQVAAALNIEY